MTKTGENRKINRTDILFYFKAGEMMSTGKERKRAGIYRLCLLVMLILLLGAAVPVSAKVTSVKNIEKVTGGRFTARNGNWYYYDKWQRIAFYLSGGKHIIFLRKGSGSTAGTRSVPGGITLGRNQKDTCIKMHGSTKMERRPIICEATAAEARGGSAAVIPIILMQRAS